MSPIQSASRRALALVSAAGAIACGDARPTAPESVPPDPALSLTAADGGALAVALGDVRSRIAPTLGTGSAPRRLDEALRRVDAAIAVRDRAGLEIALAEGDAAVDALADPGSNGPAPQDLDAIRLVLAQGHALLTAPAEDQLELVPPRNGRALR